MTDPSSPDERRATRLLLAFGALLHGALVLYAYPLRVLFSKLPVLDYDYALHAYQVSRAVEAFRQSGHLWSYDPASLAGQPVNVVEDTTNKALELFVLLAMKLGIPMWTAFKAFILGAHLSVPVFAWVSARLLGLAPRRAACAVLAWVLLWHFDSFLHWCWFIGMISWGLASAAVVLVVALQHRAFERRTAGAYAALGAGATLALLIHPFAAFPLVLPLGASYVRAFPALSRREHAALLACAVAALSTVLVWAGPLLFFRHYVGRVDAFLWPDVRYVFFDSMDLLKDILMTGSPVRTAFRILALVLAALGLAKWRRAGDRRLLPLGLLVVGSFVLAYVSGHSAALRQTQPYRNIGPAMLGAAIVGSDVVFDLFARAELARLDRTARTALAIAAVAALPHLARTVLQYVPAPLPPAVRALTALRPGPASDGTNREPAPRPERHDPLPDDYDAVARYLNEHVRMTGRVVVTVDWVLAEYLATFTDLPILGGIPQRNVPQVAAHILKYDLEPKSPGDDPFARYLEEYAVSALVTCGEDGPVDARRDLVELRKAFGLFRIYTVKRRPTFFARGSGRIVAQRVNSIKVADAEGPDVVLRFHWLETLRCRPGCAVKRAPAEGDPVGFIGVDDAPRAFEIYNEYP